MFKKLRIKFIAITMVMVAVVMALSFTVVCVVEYQRSYSVVQTALSDAAKQAMNDTRDQGGKQNHNFHEMNGLSSSGQPPFSSGMPSDSAEAQSATSAAVDGATSEENSAAPPFIGRKDGQPRASSSLIPVAVYRIDSAGDSFLIPHATTASISDDVLTDATAVASTKSDGYGTLADLDLHYYRVSNDTETFVVFADTSYTDSWKSLALMLALVGLGTLVVFFVVSLFYSNWALKPVREAWDSQRQFVADASHDLKTPLTVILANSSILLKHPDHSIASESQWIESTQVEAENMQGLINEMLELAQVEAGDKIEVEKEELDFSDLVDGETLLFDSVALERNCSFECDVEPGISVLANEKQIQKMVSTLVENAFKYVDSGGAITIDLKRSGKNAQLAVKNTGQAIAPDDLPHIFDRFYRTDKARTSGEGGFGLGLAIAKEIAVQHGGDITCTSTAEEGTTFIVTLPTL